MCTVVLMRTMLYCYVQCCIDMYNVVDLFLIGTMLYGYIAHNPLKINTQVLQIKGPKNNTVSSYVHDPMIEYET